MKFPVLLLLMGVAVAAFALEFGALHDDGSDFDFDFDADADMMNREEEPDSENRLFFGFFRCLFRNPCDTAAGEVCRFGLCFNRTSGARCFKDRQCASGNCTGDSFFDQTCT